MYVCMYIYICMSQTVVKRKEKKRIIILQRQEFIKFIEERIEVKDTLKTGVLILSYDSQNNGERERTIIICRYLFDLLTNTKRCQPCIFNCSICHYQAVNQWEVRSYLI